MLDTSYTLSYERLYEEKRGKETFTDVTAVTISDHRLRKAISDCVELTKGCIEKQEWHSKYNTYISYDYEPFAVNGFIPTFYISFPDDSYSNYFEFLFNQRVEEIKALETCYENSNETVTESEEK